jgi:hypothetical protein
MVALLILYILSQHFLVHQLCVGVIICHQPLFGELKEILEKRGGKFLIIFNLCVLKFFI